MTKENYIERIIPGQVEYSLWQEHINRYFFVLDFVNDKSVLDVACGSGYGTKLISKTARFAVGIDISHEALIFAKKDTYGSNIDFILADATNLPFREGAFESVVSFETIEHLRDYQQFLQELKYALSINGTVIISTPNGRLFRSSLEVPDNPFHFKLFEPKEFYELLSIFSDRKDCYGQCPFNLKNFVLSYLNSRLPNQIKRLYWTINRLQGPGAKKAVEEIDLKYSVRKTKNIFPLHTSVFLVIIVKNEK
jgi:SAM-dependent methyltransferase